jgi:hypothetical protein
MNLLVILLIVILLFGTGGSWYGYHNWGPHFGYGGGAVTLIIIVIIVLFLVGRL